MYALTNKWRGYTALNSLFEPCTFRFAHADDLGILVVFIAEHISRRLAKCSRPIGINRCHGPIGRFGF